MKLLYIIYVNIYIYLYPRWLMCPQRSYLVFAEKWLWFLNIWLLPIIDYDFKLIAHHQGHLNNIISPRAKQYTGAHTYITTHTTVNADKIKHIFIVLVLTTKSMFKHKKHAVHNTHRLAWGPYIVGPLGNCPVCPWVKTVMPITMIDF